MKKFSKIVNFTAFIISALTVVIVVVLILLYSIPPEIQISETEIELNMVKITKRQTNSETTYYASNLQKNAPFYIVLGFDLHELEQIPIHLTINDSSIIYIIVINNQEIANIVYQDK